jgi:DNA-binding winged helix-turn-helix (wHTH) protein/tetratricopeptide (TPR) repeat protein
MVLRFSGFELDRQRADLRGPDGEAIKLRPKTLGILNLLAANAERILSKQELMDAVWPNVHVGDDSLFQCIRELRTALGDDQRQLIKLVSGRGYLFTPEVSIEPTITGADVPLPDPVPFAEPSIAAELVSPSRLFGLRPPVAFTVAGFGAIFALAVIATIVGPRLLSGPRPPAIAVMPIAAAGGDAEIAAVAADVTSRLADGLAKIENIRVSLPPAAPQASHAPQADFVVSGELQKSERSWEVRARMTRIATGDVVWTAPVSVVLEDSDLSLQQSRLAAGIGHPLALRINALLNSDTRMAGRGRGSSPGSANVVIEQATASIVQTTRDRFATAQAMLEKALADDPDNVDLAVSLAVLQLRGIQMVWYSPADSTAAESKARSILERALQLKPNSLPVLEGYCRFLSATNEFVESLVACARTLSFDPWNGLALYNAGLAQVQLGRFEDALATFKQADRFDTPQVSRWTWQLGAGLTYLVMGRSEDALPWLQRSIAITPGSGRSYMLLSAAYHNLGQPAEARLAMEKALALRPGSNAGNIALPPKNASPVFLAAVERIERACVAAGLPEH